MLNITVLIANEGINILYVDDEGYLILNDIEDGSLSPDYMFDINYSKKYNSFHKALLRQIDFEQFIESLDLSDDLLNILRSFEKFEKPIEPHLCVRFQSSFDSLV
jgi:hypothetical protein